MSEPAESTDEQLFARFLNGDLDGFAALARRLEPALHGIACGLLTANHHLAHDAVQDTWLRALKSAHSFAGNSKVKTWIYRILINRCHDLRAKHLRHASPAQSHLSLPDLDAGFNTTDYSHPDPALIQCVRTAMHALPGSAVEILILCYHQQLTLVEAADVLQIPVGTLKSRLASALDQLRKQLREEIAP